MSLQIGQRIHIDLFGLRVAAFDSRAAGTVVALGPGVITVRLERADGAYADVTVSPGRIEWIPAGR